MAKRTTKKPQRNVHPSFTGIQRSDLLKHAEASGEVSEEDIEILTEAYERFEYCSSWESQFRDLYMQDVKFANADSDNGWQWPDDLRRDRMLNRRPALT